MTRVNRREFYDFVTFECLLNEGPVYEIGYTDEEFYYQNRREVGAFIRYLDNGQCLYFIKE